MKTESFASSARLEATISIIADLARQGKTMTYLELAEKMGVHHRSLRLVLEPIQEFCRIQKLPPLTVLIVNQDTNKPGAGNDHHRDSETFLDAVTSFDWANYEFPSGARLTRYKKRMGN